MKKSKVYFNVEKVRELMKQEAVTPRTLRRKAVISVPCYREIMQTGSCDIATLGRIANALDAFVSELLEESEEKSV